MRYLRTGVPHLIAISAAVLLVSIGAEAADELEFVSIPQEATFLMYEEWGFHFMAINHTGSPIEYRYLVADDQCIFHRIRDASGDVLDCPYLTGEYVPWPKQEIPAHDTAHGYATIVRESWGPNFDPITRLATMQPGEYTVEFIWLYDPHARALYGGSRYLYDTVHVTVIMPLGSDSLAMDMYVKANADYQRVYVEEPELAVRLQAMEERSRRYIEIFESHPTSCFARMALEKVISSASGRNLPEFEGYRVSDLTAIYVFRYPERPFAQYSMRTLAKADFIPDSEKKGVLRKIADSLKQSEIGRLANSLIIDPYEGRERR